MNKELNKLLKKIGLVTNLENKLGLVYKLAVVVLIVSGIRLYVIKTFNQFLEIATKAEGFIRKIDCVEACNTVIHITNVNKSINIYKYT